jgi:hypothetical protein
MTQISILDTSTYVGKTKQELKASFPQNPLSGEETKTSTEEVKDLTAFYNEVESWTPSVSAIGSESQIKSFVESLDKLSKIHIKGSRQRVKEIILRQIPEDRREEAEHLLLEQKLTFQYVKILENFSVKLHNMEYGKKDECDV